MGYIKVKGVSYRDTDKDITILVSVGSQKMMLAEMRHKARLFSSEEGYPETYNNRCVPYKETLLTIAEALLIKHITAQDVDKYI